MKTRTLNYHLSPFVRNSRWSQFINLSQRMFQVDSGFSRSVLAALLLLPLRGVVCGEIVGPYTVDDHTLHLWHMDESAVPVVDAVTNGIPLTGLDNGATLGNESYNNSKKFGTALGTYTGNPLMDPGSAGQGAFLSALPL